MRDKAAAPDRGTGRGLFFFGGGGNRYLRRRFFLKVNFRDYLEISLL